MHLLLDMFHGMKRITDTLSKSHGAYRLFCSLLRDCFFLIYKEDSESVEKCLRDYKGYNDSEIKAFKRNCYSKYISYCRRVVPQPSVILSRLERLVDVMSEIEDFSTGEKLFKDSTFKEILNLSKHIKNKCLSDPEGVPMYMKISKKGVNFDSTDLPLVRYTCLRSTSQLEGTYCYIFYPSLSRISLKRGQIDRTTKLLGINSTYKYHGVQPSFEPSPSNKTRPDQLRSM